MLVLQDRALDPALVDLARWHPIALRAVGLGPRIGHLQCGLIFEFRVERAIAPLAGIQRIGLRGNRALNSGVLIEFQRIVGGELIGEARATTDRPRAIPDVCARDVHHLIIGGLGRRVRVPQDHHIAGGRRAAPQDRHQRVMVVAFGPLENRRAFLFDRAPEGRHRIAISGFHCLSQSGDARAGELLLGRVRRRCGHALLGRDDGFHPEGEACRRRRRGPHGDLVDSGDRRLQPEGPALRGWPAEVIEPCAIGSVKRAVDAPLLRLDLARAIFAGLQADAILVHCSGAERLFDALPRFQQRPFAESVEDRLGIGRKNRERVVARLRGKPHGSVDPVRVAVAIGDLEGVRLDAP